MTEFVFPIRVYIEDTDYGGVVYHANYLKYFERARSEWLEHLNFGVDWHQEQKLFFVVRNATLDYMKPAKLNQNLEVVTQVTEIKRVSVVFEQYLRLKEIADTILCRASIKIACIDYDFKLRVLPKQLVEILQGERA